MVVYCKSVHFHGFEDAQDNLGFYEMSSFKEGKALKLAEESGEDPIICVPSRVATRKPECFVAAATKQQQSILCCCFNLKAATKP